MDELAPVSPKKRMPWWGKALVGIGALIGLCVIMFVSAVVIRVVQDLKYDDLATPPEDSDLSLPAIIEMPPAHRNGHFLMQKLAEVPEGDAQAAFEAIDSISRSSDGYVDPYLANPASYVALDDAPVPPLGSYRRAVSVANEYVTQLFEAGKQEAAIDGSINIMYVASLNGRARSSVLELLASYARMKTTAENLTRLAARYTGDPGMLEAAERYLQSYEPRSSLLAEAFKIQYLELKQTIQKTAREDRAYLLEHAPGLRVSEFTYFPNENTGYAAAAAREWVRIAEQPCDVSFRAATPVTRVSKNPLALFFTPNAVGKSIEWGAGMGEHTKERECMATTAVRAARLVSMIRAGELRGNPDSVRSWKASILDPFSSAAFVDGSDRQLISVGPDHTLGTEDDLVYRY